MKRLLVNLIPSILLISGLFSLQGCGKAETSAIWHMINVNTDQLQGDAHLIEVDSQNIMIDAGYYGEANTQLIPYLNNLDISIIHHFFISHPHRDHYEGLRSMIENGMQIEHVYFNMPPKRMCDKEIPWGCNYADLEALMAELKAVGSQIHSIDNTFTLNTSPYSKFEILHAMHGEKLNSRYSINDLSQIMKWTVNGISVLFTGDLDRTLGQELSDDTRIASHILKMPHHGGRSIAPLSFFRKVDPQAILVPGPEWVWCGERGGQPREWVKGRQMPVWVNGIDGHIKLTFTQNTVLVQPEHPNENCKFRDFSEMKLTFDTN